MVERGYDRLFLAGVLLLIIIGLTAVYSSTSVVSPEPFQKGKEAAASQFGHLKKQMLTMMMGLAVMFVAAKVPLRHIGKMYIGLLVFSLVCLGLVFTPLGVTVNGARRWIRVWPSSFQPSELVKLCMVIFMARYMSSPLFRANNFKAFIIPIGVMGVFQAVFLKQPDFGAVMSLAILTLSMLFLGGVRMRYLMCLSLLALPVLYKLAMAPYRLKRIIAFLDPWKEAKGSGFQLVQSFIALGSGGLHGVGLGEGRQKLAYLPEIHTDFIFALIGEELGFVGAVFVVILFLALFFRGLGIAQKNEADPFSYYLAYGITLMIGVQAVINFFVVTGMAPTKGLPLPFISYGGSSLIVNMTAVGLLLNLSRMPNISAQAAGDRRGEEPPPPRRSQVGGHGPLREYGYRRYAQGGRQGVRMNRRPPGYGR